MQNLDIMAFSPTTWLPTSSPLTHFSSMIWSEKFFEHSEFELRTHDVRRTMDLLPLGSLVGLRQSKEIMMVERQVIETDDNGFELLTISGRSLTSFIEYRVIGEKRGNKYQAMVGTNLESGLILLYNSLVNDQAWDLTTGAAAYYKNPDDAIPNLIVTDSTGELSEPVVDDPSQQRWLDPGTISDPIRNFFSERPYGLRILRPKNTVHKVSVTPTGTVSSALTFDSPDLCLDVYVGKDRSVEQTDIAAVVFDTEVDDLITPGYSFGITNLRTEAHICLPDKAILHESESATGLNRRVIFIDAGDPEEGYNATEWESYNVRAAGNLLEEQTRIHIVEGEVSPQSRLVFGTDYDLGDLVTVRGKYGSISKARVSEYIRAYDENGVVNYPSLIRV